MISKKMFSRIFFMGLLSAGALAQAASVSGVVTDKTTGKPAVGDTVVLVDVQAGMGEAAHATTDARGHYTLDLPGNSPYLVRVTHQGAGYFIAAPQGGASGDIAVYDVSAKVQGVMIEANVIEVETDNGMLKVDERYYVHNTSTPPTTQWTKKSFEIVLPPDAVINDAGAQRPGGLPTSIKLDPDGPKGHYSFNFPIQPDDGEKDTMFQISYGLPYDGGKYDFKSIESLPADNVAVLMPKSMNFVPGAGTSFKAVQEDPGVLTYLMKNVTPGKTIEFTVSGNGAMPREAQGGGGAGPQPPADSGGGAAQSGPGGGIGEPINTPDPLSKYKWWILGGLGIVLAAAAAFLLRKPEVAQGAMPVQSAASPAVRTAGFVAAATPQTKHASLLEALKEELFALESERIAGKISDDEYAQVKGALEIVLRRALQRNG